MRVAALVLLLVASSPAFAARAVTAAQLEQQLAALRAKPDDEAARFLGDFQLSERVTAERLAQLQSQAPGEKSRQVLLALADQAAFLVPAAAPARPAPDVAEQRRIMGLTVAYVSKTIPQRPNFIATRVTTRFQDTPLIQKPMGGFIPYEPIHPVGTETTPILYDNGRETVQLRAKSQSAEGLRTDGLRTWGVFGPILGTVLVDAAQSKLAWARWEQEPDGLRAVFTYAVPREKSHYEVNFCCIASESALVAASVRAFQQITPYHGEIAVDPETGVIRRLILQADLKPNDPVVRADILVDYSPVEIAGRTYACPVHSISVSRAQTVQVDPVYKYALARQLQPLKNSLNDVRFEEYHVYRGEARMVADASAAGDAAPGSTPQPPATPGESTAPPASQPTATASPAPAQPAANAPPAAPEESASAATPASSAPSKTAADSSSTPPSTPYSPPLAPSSGVTLRVTTRLVDVPVVAFDKKGRLITDLTPADLEVYDNGRPQQIRFFSHEGREAFPGSAADSPQATSAQPGAPPDQPPAQAASTAGPPAPSPSATILLIDAANVAFSDLSYTRSEMLRFLSRVASDERVGVYIMKRTGIDVLLEPTTNHAAVGERLSSWTPNAQDLQNAQHEEQRTRQSMEYVHSITDLAYVNGNTPTGLGDMSLPVDPQLRSLGDHPELNALILLAGVARHLGTIPGHKSLVWVSSDNVLADFSDKAPSVEKGSKYIDTTALLARESLNEAHVSIYPLDASQLEAGGASAEMRAANVQLQPTANPEIQLNELPPGEREEAVELLRKSQRDIYSGRVTAQKQQDEHAIQPAFRELAEATGGRALRRAGDIAAELSQIVADGREAYLVSFRPDQPPDGAYHQITVKCARPGATLRYRTGYFYAKAGAMPARP